MAILIIEYTPVDYSGPIEFYCSRCPRSHIVPAVEMDTHAAAHGAVGMRVFSVVQRNERRR